MKEHRYVTRYNHIFIKEQQIQMCTKITAECFATLYNNKNSPLRDM